MLHTTQYRPNPYYHAVITEDNTQKLKSPRPRQLGGLARALAGIAISLSCVCEDDGISLQRSHGPIGGHGTQNPGDADILIKIKDPIFMHGGVCTQSLSWISRPGSDSDRIRMLESALCVCLGCRAY